MVVVVVGLVYMTNNISRLAKWLNTTLFVEKATTK
jgi:hypothetical protein